MKVISKFVINRNHIHYFYVEKQLHSNHIEYIVNDGNNFHTLNSETFQSTFGNDKKMSIISFLEKVSIDISTTESTDIALVNVYNQTCNLEEKIRQEKEYIYNPSLVGYGHTFITILNSYNSLVATRKNDEIDYEEEYNRVQNLIKKKELE